MLAYTLVGMGVGVVAGVVGERRRARGRGKRDDAQTLQSTEDLRQQLKAEHAARSQVYAGQANELEQQLAKERAAKRALEQQLAAELTAKRALEQQLAAERDRSAKLQKQAKELEVQVDGAENQAGEAAAAAREREAKLQEQLAAEQDRSAKLQKQAKELEVQVDGAEKAQHQAGEAAAAAREREAKLQEQVKALEKDLAEGRTAGTQAAQKAKELEAELSAAKEAQAAAAQARQQLEQATSRSTQALAAREAEAAAAAKSLEAAQLRLKTVQATVVEALGAETKQDALTAALNALTAVLPEGAAAYVAELRTAADVDGEDPAAVLVAEADAAAAAAAKVAAEGGTPTPLPPALETIKGVTPGFLTSPLASVVGGGIRRTSTNEPDEPTELAAVKETLVFKYIRASGENEFMLGQKLPYGSGVSWRLLDDHRDAVHIADVAAEPGMFFFRELPSPRKPELALASRGSYVAAPILGSSRELVGMLCVDTLGTQEVLGDAAVAFVRGLAGAIGSRASADYDAFWEAMVAMAMEATDQLEAASDAASEQQLEAEAAAAAAAEAEAANASIEAHARAHMRWAAGVHAITATHALRENLEARLRTASAALMKAFSSESCNSLTELKAYRIPPPLTLSVLKCVLMLGGYGELEEWGRIRVLVNHALIKKLVLLRPAQVPRPVFAAVRAQMKALLAAEIKQESQAALALYRWLTEFLRFAGVRA